MFFNPFYLEFQAAKKSIQFYQNIRQTEEDQKTLKIEVNKLIGIVNSIQTKGDGNSLDLSEFRTRVAQKALLIGINLMVMNQLTGVVAMMSYSSKIFENAGSSYLSPNISTIVIGIIQLISNCITMNLVDRRKV